MRHKDGSPCFTATPGEQLSCSCGPDQQIPEGYRVLTLHCVVPVGALEVVQGIAETAVQALTGDVPSTP